MGDPKGTVGNGALGDASQAREERLMRETLGGLAYLFDPRYNPFLTSFVKNPEGGNTALYAPDDNYQHVELKLDITPPK